MSALKEKRATHSSKLLIAKSTENPELPAESSSWLQFSEVLYSQVEREHSTRGLGVEKGIVWQPIMIMHFMFTFEARGDCDSDQGGHGEVSP
jgi:hypothetical protein